MTADINTKRSLTDDSVAPKDSAKRVKLEEGEEREEGGRDRKRFAHAPQDEDEDGNDEYGTKILVALHFEKVPFVEFMMLERGSLRDGGFEELLEEVNRYNGCDPFDDGPLTIWRENDASQALREDLVDSINAYLNSKQRGRRLGMHNREIAMVINLMAPTSPVHSQNK